MIFLLGGAVVAPILIWAVLSDLGLTDPPPLKKD